MTPHFTFNNGAIRSGGNTRSLESLLLQAQQLWQNDAAGLVMARERKPAPPSAKLQRVE